MLELSIAMCLLNIDYDNCSLFHSQMVFSMCSKKYGWSKLTKNLKAKIQKNEAFKGIASQESKPGKIIAVKIVDIQGIESLEVIGVD